MRNLFAGLLIVLAVSVVAVTAGCKRPPRANSPSYSPQSYEPVNNVPSYEQGAGSGSRNAPVHQGSGSR